MKYDHNRRMPKNWDVENLGKLLLDIKLQIFDFFFENTDYMIERNNLLKNDGIVEHDQKPHSDYPMRLSNT